MKLKSSSITSDISLKNVWNCNETYSICSKFYLIKATQKIFNPISHHNSKVKLSQPTCPLSINIPRLLDFLLAILP
jgi:hypothetical protein